MNAKLAIGICTALLPLAFLAGKGSAPPTPTPQPPPEFAALKAEVSAMRRETAAKEEGRTREVESLRVELALVRSENARLASVTAAKPEPSREAAPAPALASGGDREFEALAARLTAPGATLEERTKAWADLIQAGFLDRTVALFEKRAKENPASADAQMEAARAYVQKIMTVPDGPVKGFWATKADQAYDAALQLDSRHWEARFSKAIGLSFWPPIFGKQSEAVRQFEILVQQQEEGVAESRFAQTYLLLGNLYEQQGRHEKAVEVWGRGASLFPRDDGLRARVSK